MINKQLHVLFVWMGGFLGYKYRCPHRQVINQYRISVPNISTKYNPIKPLVYRYPTTYHSEAIPNQIQLKKTPPPPTKHLIIAYKPPHKKMPGLPPPPPTGAAAAVPTLCEYRATNSSRASHGIFARQDIACGITILTEQPLLRSATGTLQYHTKFHALNAGSKKKFFSLSNSDPNVPNRRQLRSDTIRGIWKTNRMVAGDEDAVFEMVSRINHNCYPNAKLYWNLKTGCMEVKASRNMILGEEVEISYIDHNAELEVRGEMLQSWMISCLCPRCFRGTMGACGAWGTMLRNSRSV